MKNTTEVRTFLITQMRRLESGQQGVDEAKAMCNYAQQVYNQTNLEFKTAMAARRFAGFEINAIAFTSDMEVGNE